MKDVYLRDGIRTAEKEYMQSTGVHEAELIERAAAAAFRVISERFTSPESVLIAAGKGNNGGDGKALFRLLQAAGFPATLTDIGAGAEVPDGEFGIVIDAVFGIGLDRPVSGHYLAAIEKLNALKGFKIALDTPSGLSADGGRVLGAAFRADLTLTFNGIKAGLLLEDGKDHAGEILICDIGIPCCPSDSGALTSGDKDNPVFAAPPARLFGAEDFRPKQRRQNSHKGDYGRVRVIAGSREMPGAAVIAASAARAALKGGAGLVTLCAPESLASEYVARALEYTLMFLPDKGGKILFDAAAAEKVCDKADAIAVGPGLGDNAEELRKYITFFAAMETRLIIDADGLNALSGDLSAVADARAEIILTPHLLEFSRLSGKSLDEIRRSPVAAAKAFARERKVTLVLKGASSVITDGNETLIVTAGTPALAKGGSGDILTGLTAALACGYPPLTAAAYAAYILGTTAERAEKKYGRNSLLSSELVNEINF